MPFCLRCKTILTSIVVLAVSYCSLSAQEFDLLATPTDEHELIPETQIYIIPPPDYNISDHFSGLEYQGHPETAIIVTNIPGPFSTTITRFNDDLLEIRNMKVDERRIITVPGYSCVFLNIKHDVDDTLYRKYILIIGDAYQSFIIQAIAPDDDEDLVNQIKDAISSTVISSLPTLSPRSLLDYKVDEKKGGFMLATVLSNGMVFTRDGKIPPQSSDKTVIFFDKAHTRLRILNKLQFALDRLSQYPGDFRVIKAEDTKKIKQSGMEGYEIIAYNKKSSNEALKQVILFEKKGAYFVMTAIYDPNNGGVLADIDRVLKSFKRR